jgi:hypothetical protein
MADPRINATFTATDKVTPTVKAMRGEITKLGSKTGGPLGGLLGGIGGLNLGMVGLGVGVVGAVGALGDFAMKAIEDQQNVDHLTASLKANVPGWNGATDAIDAFIKRGQDLAFTDDDIRNSISQLVTRTHDVAKAITITREAMDLARLKSMSLADASSILGKVFSGQTAAAKRAGIAIDKNATSTEALAQIQQAASGQADTYAKSQAGTIARISDQFKEMEETIGRGVLGVIDDLGTAFNNLQRAMNPALGVTQDMEAAIRKQADALGVDADAAVAFYETQQQATAAAAANAQALQDQAIAAEIAANANETLYDVSLKLNVSIADVIRVSNGMSTATQQVADYTQSAAGVVNQYAATLKSTTPLAEAYRKRQAEMTSGMGASAEALRGYEGAWRGAAINIPAAISDMRIATHAQFKSLLSQDKKDLKQLIHDINHPGESKNLLKWLPKAMTKAQDALHTAQTTGDQVAIAEAQDLIAKLNAQFALLHGPTTVSVHTVSGGGGRVRVRASGGPWGPGEAVLVGENGPEVLHTGGTRGYVTPGRGATNGGGGGHTTLVYLNGDLIAKQVDDYQGRRWPSAGTGRSRN